MWNHLSEQAMTDLLLGEGDARAREHAAACASCGGRLEQARAGLGLARGVDVPEPSPLYWDAMKRHLGQRIAAEHARPRFRLRPLPVAAAALAIAAAVILPGMRQPARVLPAWSALPPAELDASLVVLEGLETSWEDAAELGVCASVDGCLVRLGEDESRALAETLRAELLGRKS